MPALFFAGSEEEARKAVREVLNGMAGSRIVADHPDCLRAEFVSRWFRFVDDVEVSFDSVQKRIDYRSASRHGYYDLGVNRRRMARLARELTRRFGFSSGH